MIGRLLRNDDVLRLIVLVALVIIFGLLTNGVTYSPLGLRNILQQSAIVGIAAIGQAFVILTGAIDVSLYGTGMLVSVVGASALTSWFDLNLFGGDPSSIWTGAGIMLAVGAIDRGCERRPCGLGADTLSSRYLRSSGRSASALLSSLAADTRSPISRRTSAFSGNRRSQASRSRSSRCSFCSCSRRTFCTTHPSGDRSTRSAGTRRAPIFPASRCSVSSLRCL